MLTPLAVAKNKGKYKSKDPVLATEPGQELISAGRKIYESVRPHAVKVGAVLGGLILVLVGFAIGSWWDERQEAKATRIFGEAMEILRSPIEPPAVGEGTSNDSAPKPGEPKKYASAQQRAQAALAVLDRLEADLGKTDVAAQARLVRAGVLYDLGRYDEAIAAYRAVASASDATRVQKILAYEGLGYALEAKGALDEAIEMFRQLQPDEKGYYRDRALYHQARLLAKKGNRKEAVTLFQQILEKFPTSPIRREVQNRLSTLEEQG